MLGVGPGGLGVHFRGRDARLYPHNIVLELGSETGGFGVSLFLVVVGVPMIRALARMRRARGVSKTVLCFLITASSFLLLNAMMSGDVNDNRMLFAFIPLLSSITERLWEQPNG
ncbi:MAG: hypothetical protein DRH24_19735 [Deltaproteobacteria bacterium]|nr:MAG: hypothetical protein DRH24_19735 [Deltaproteobacteria bacterium]